MFNKWAVVLFYLDSCDACSVGILINVKPSGGFKHNHLLSNPVNVTFNIAVKLVSEFFKEECVLVRESVCVSVCFR